MRKLLLATAGLGVATAFLATPAQAGCFTPGGPFPTVQVCVGPDIDLDDILR